MKVLKYSSVTIILILQLVKKRYIVMGFVEAVACNTDIPCLLLCLMTLVDLVKSIFISSMQLNKSTGQHVTCRIQDVVEKKTKSMGSVFCSPRRSEGAKQSLV